MNFTQFSQSKLFLLLIELHPKPRNVYYNSLMSSLAYLLKFISSLYLEHNSPSLDRYHFCLEEYLGSHRSSSKMLYVDYCANRVPFLVRYGLIFEEKPTRLLHLCYHGGCRNDIFAFPKEASSLAQVDCYRAFF